MDEPKGRKRSLTDEQLRQELESHTQAEIAAKYGISAAAVSKRVKRLQVGTVAAVVAPQEARRFVSRTIDAMEELARSLERANLLSDACDEWLRDAKRPDRYSIGPRAEEVQVTYLTPNDQGNLVKEKASLAELLARVEERWEVDRTQTRTVDPRDLILRTASETRQIVSTAADLAQKLLIVRAMETFRQVTLEEIAKESPPVAQRIAEAVRRSILLHNALGGPAALPAGHAAGDGSGAREG